MWSTESLDKSSMKSRGLRSKRCLEKLSLRSLRPRLNMRPVSLHTTLVMVTNLNQTLKPSTPYQDRVMSQLTSTLLKILITTDIMDIKATVVVVDIMAQRDGLRLQCPLVD